MVVHLYFFLLKTMCTVIAMVLHYAFLSVFGWMLAEGINLYIKIVKVYGSEKSRLPLYLGIGWGIPAVIVGVSGAMKYDSYTTPNRLVYDTIVFL